MTTSLAPRTCTRCGHDYTVKPGQAKYNRHMFGVCQRCKDPRADAYSRHSEYSHIKPIADEDDDTRPVWRYHTATGVWILMPDDVPSIVERMSDYWTKKLGGHITVALDVDDDAEITGDGIVTQRGRIYARFRMERIKALVSAI